LQIIESIFA